MNQIELLRLAAERGIRYRETLAQARVTPSASPDPLRTALGGPAPDLPSDPEVVLTRLADIIEAGGLMGMGSGRVGWDVEADGLTGAPAIRFVVGEEVHVTVPRGARLLGMGTRSLVRVDVDANGAMRPDALEQVLAAAPTQPTIDCCQTGNVNTGAIDPVGALAAIAHRHGAWLHVDGAIGLWAAAVRPSRLPGLELADSWSTDAHRSSSTARADSEVPRGEGRP